VPGTLSAALFLLERVPGTGGGCGIGEGVPGTVYGGGIGTGARHRWWLRHREGVPEQVPKGARHRCTVAVSGRGGTGGGCGIGERVPGTGVWWRYRAGGGIGRVPGTSLWQPAGAASGKGCLAPVMAAASGRGAMVQVPGTSWWRPAGATSGRGASPERVPDTGVRWRYRTGAVGRGAWHQLEQGAQKGCLAPFFYVFSFFQCHGTGSRHQFVAAGRGSIGEGVSEQVPGTGGLARVPKGARLRCTVAVSGKGCQAPFPTQFSLRVPLW
jgi:hypothetical protein